MSKMIMLLAGGLEIVAGIIFLLIVKFTFMGILFLVAGLLFVVAGLLTKNAE